MCKHRYVYKLAIVTRALEHPRLSIISFMFSGRPKSPELVDEVVAMHDMWDVLEHHYEQLEESDKGRVVSKVGLSDTNMMFEGFYANEESRHLSVARFLIKDLERFPRFKDRGLNSNSPVVGWYRKMLTDYGPMRETLLGRRLSVREIVSLLLERIHPDNRNR